MYSVVVLWELILLQNGAIGLNINVEKNKSNGAKEETQKKRNTDC